MNLILPTYKPVTINEWMIVVDHCLEESICDLIINHTKSKLKHSGILGEQIKDYRTSKDHFLETSSYENTVLNSILNYWTSIDSSNYESASIINYSSNQEYKEHYDFLYHLEGETEAAGDRIFTAIFYLNDNFTGGETYFQKIDTAIIPKKGRLVIWKNYIDGVPNFDSLHCGMKVESGQKWIATKWIREKKFKID